MVFGIFTKNYVPTNLGNQLPLFGPPFTILVLKGIRYCLCDDECPMAEHKYWPIKCLVAMFLIGGGDFGRGAVIALLLWLLVSYHWWNIRRRQCRNGRAVEYDTSA